MYPGTIDASTTIDEGGVRWIRNVAPLAYAIATTARRNAAVQVPAAELRTPNDRPPRHTSRRSVSALTARKQSAEETFRAGLCLIKLRLGVLSAAPVRRGHRPLYLLDVLATTSPRRFSADPTSHCTAHGAFRSSLSITRMSTHGGT